jgi:hypothetical protein
MSPERPRPIITVEHGAKSGDCHALLRLLLALLGRQQDKEPPREEKRKASPSGLS